MTLQCYYLASGPRVWIRGADEKWHRIDNIQLARLGNAGMRCLVRPVSVIAVGTAPAWSSPSLALLLLDVLVLQCSVPL